jgi:hypothetical protein
MRGILLSIISFFGILLSFSAYATDYYWQYSSGSPHYSSPSSACDAVMTAYYGGTTFGGYTYSGAVKVSVDTYQCQGTNSSGSTTDLADVSRQGDSCSEGSTYDSSTGTCKSSQKDGDLCSDQTGAISASSSSIAIPMIYDSTVAGCVKFPDAAPAAMCKYMASTDNGTSSATYSVDGISNDIGLGVAPPTFVTDAGGCEYKTLLTTSCKVMVDGTSTCVVTAQLTGNVGTVTSGDTTKSSLCTSPAGCKVDTTPQTTYTDTGCAEKGNCTEETKSDTSGSQDCLTNGSLVCNNSKPTSTATKTTTSTASTNNTDGSVSSTVTADTTTTKCTDLNTCITKTSTTNTTSKTTASGSTSTTSTCTGSCNANGTATTPGEGDDDENTDEGSASASSDCKVPPACDGDPFSCALLKQAWIDSCAVRALPTVAEKADADAAVAKQVAALDANQQTLDDSVSSLVSGFQSATSTSVGGQCFTDKTFPVQGYSITLPFSQTCPYLEWLRYGVLCVAYLIALRIVTKEI